MADERVVSDIVTKFLLNTCRLCPRITRHGVQAALSCAWRATYHPRDDAEAHLIPLITGSVAEFYIETMLPIVGDVDVMCHRSTMLAIAQGHPPPTQLPAEFSNYVKVFEIVGSHLPGYVYLQLRYLLSRCINNDIGIHFTYDNGYYLSYQHSSTEKYSRIHGPAICLYDSDTSLVLSIDSVPCVRCLSWPPQATDWPTRHKLQLARLSNC